MQSPVVAWVLAVAVSALTFAAVVADGTLAGPAGDLVGILAFLVLCIVMASAVVSLRDSRSGVYLPVGLAFLAISLLHAGSDLGSEYDGPGRWVLAAAWFVVALLRIRNSRRA